MKLELDRVGPEVELPEQLLHEAVEPIDTRAAAGRAIRGRAGTLRAAVLRFIEERADAGGTDEEIYRALRMHADTARARRCELRDAGLIRDSGRRRRNKGGHPMTVWIVTGRPSVGCNHLDPTTWQHTNGAAYCSTCGKWMGFLH